MPATPRPGCAAAPAQTRGLHMGVAPMPGHGAPLGVLRGSVSSVAVPHCWFLSHRANSQVLLLQHPHFQRAHPTAEEPGALGGNAGLFAKQQKKRKKKRCASPRGAMSQDTRGEQSWQLQPHELGWHSVCWNLSQACLGNNEGLRLDP